MEHKKHSGGPGFNLFFIGILVGVALTLLLTTKKGRKILQIIIDEGVEKLSKWEDVIDVLEKNSKKVLDQAENVTQRVKKDATEAQIMVEEAKEEVIKTGHMEENVKAF